MAYDKIIITRLWLAISMVGFPKHITKLARLATEEQEISYIQTCNQT
jgi:hypothetical protein